jgi:activator of 2-hydroxyglutaryl-CoA dehydratase
MISRWAKGQNASISCSLFRTSKIIGHMRRQLSSTTSFKKKSAPIIKVRKKLYHLRKLSKVIYDIGGKANKLFILKSGKATVESYIEIED